MPNTQVYLSLSDVMKERKKYYSSLIKRANKAIDLAYKTNNLEIIEGIETAALLLDKKTSELEKMLTSEQEQKSPQTPAIQKINSYKDYAALRNSGLTHLQIRDDYKVDNLHSLAGYARWYSTRNKSKKIQKYSARPAAKRPILTYQAYSDLKEQGIDDESILRGYRIKSGKSFGGIKGAHAKYRKPRRK